MATYGYRCGQDGPVDVILPIGTAPTTISCPSCGGSANRVYTAPRLGLADRGRMAVIDHAEASRSAPPVVSSLPARPGGRRPRALDPRLSTLPRP
ncbi:MAG TPA: zinc ribbon domain-containing protein [Pseudonocardia sp.]|jgi:putative FmdB family regulatory protein